MKFLIFLLTIISLKAYAQFENHQYSEEIIKDIIANTKDNPDQDDVNYYYQEGAWKFSFVGDYKNTLKFWDIINEKPAPLTAEDSLYFNNLKPFPAVDFIKEKAKNERIVILNEAHHIPLHRVFAASLLKDLYESGFTYFGFESYDKNDSLLNSRGFPVTETGYYSREPQFGNLIRTALDLGFEVFPYEADMQIHSGKDREIQQAKNIQKVLEKDPEAKIFIYAGFDHIREDSLFNSWEKAMAGRLKEYTGINPFTIDQVVMTETSKPEYDNSFFRLSNQKEAVVYADSTGKPFNGSPSENKYDLSVFHPRTTYKHGRPGWVFSGGRSPYFIPAGQVDIDCPCLIFAYKSNEPENAIPADITELQNAQEKKALALLPGAYKVVVKNKKKEEREFEIQVR